MNFSEQQFEQMKAALQASVTQADGKANFDAYLKDFMQGLLVQENQQRQSMETVQEQLKRMQQDTMSQLMQNRQQQQLPPEIMEIVNLLKIAPAIIPAVKAFIAKLSKDIADVVNRVVKENMPQPPQPGMGATP